MALIGCPECGREVSAAATACPQCGHPLKKEETPFLGKPGSFSNALNVGCLAIIIVVVAALLLKSC